jgi:hypothetical protein
MNTIRPYYLSLLFLLFSFGIHAQTLDSKLSNNTNSNTDEGEAHIAIDPNDSLKMVLGFMEIGFSGVDFKVYHSSNGGNTWQASTLNTASIMATDFPGHTIVGGGDVVFAYDNNGNLYCTWIYLLGNLSLPNFADSLRWASYWAKSTDNGNTFTLASNSDRFFGEGKLAISSTGNISVHNYKDGICDRQWLATDLSSGPFQNRLYIGYINYGANSIQDGLKVKTKDLTQNSFSAPNTAYLGAGQLSNLQVDTNGILHYSFCDINSNQVYHVSSTNGGSSFSSPHLVYTGNMLFPTTGTTHDRENASPSLAIDGANNLHLVWGDFVSNQAPQAYYSYSTNAGLTWSTPLDLSTLFGSTCVMPVVSAKGNKVSIGANVLNAQNLSEYYIISSNDNGLTFANPVKVSSGITNFNTIGQAFLGDYSSSIRTNCNIYSLWTDCRSNGCKQYIAKYNECLTTGIVELTPVKSNFSIEHLYPVPVTEQLNVELNLNQADRLLIEVFEVNGQKVYEEQRSFSAGKAALNLKTGDYSSGQYVLRLSSTAGSYITRSFLKK